MACCKWRRRVSTEADYKRLAEIFNELSEVEGTQDLLSEMYDLLDRLFSAAQADRDAAPAARTKWTPRPTTYRGIEMRSRLEATVAERLDRGGYTWEYEPRAFAGYGGQYLPDFLVNTALGDMYLEVKPTREAAEKVRDRMAIIRQSIPDAMLIIEVVGVGAYQLRPGEHDWLWFDL